MLSKYVKTVFFVKEEVSYCYAQNRSSTYKSRPKAFSGVTNEALKIAQTVQYESTKMHPGQRWYTSLSCFSVKLRDCVGLIGCCTVWRRIAEIAEVTYIA